MQRGRWYPLGTGSGGGSGNCSSPTGSPGNITYNNDYHTFQYCNGANWVKFGGGSSFPLPGSSDGYFVMSKSTWTGNLGDLSGADAKCLTELTTNTGWRGYMDANSRGILISGHVHAFLCDGASYPGTCTTPQANTRFFFADANNSRMAATASPWTSINPAITSGLTTWHTGINPLISGRSTHTGRPARMKVQLSLVLGLH